MKSILLCGVLALSWVSNLGSSEVQKPTVKKEEKKQEPKKESRFSRIKARITYWTCSEPGYKWGKKVASCPTKVATEGETSAIDPTKISYGTKLWIPELNGVVGDGLFIADDTGSAVKKMQAIPKAKQKEIQYVIDIYVDSIQKMNQLANGMPQYMEVYLCEG
jgi:3D (Asp-Asp-Asp) domain-containing protein